MLAVPVAGEPGTLLRKQVREVLLGNVVFPLLPFAASLAAEFIHAAGVLAVVVCGLIMAQMGPRVGDAATRATTMAFWRFTTFVLNATLFDH